MFKKIFAVYLLSISSLCFADQKISLSKKQWYTLDNESKFQVTKVLDDSRCPRDAKCVWAGRVSIEIELVSLKKTKKIVLSPSRGADKVFAVNFKPQEKVEKNKDLYNAFSWKKITYKLKSVSPYPGFKEKEAYVFEITKPSL